MTFLAPFILWGLPLILLPVLIHLMNRLRHRSMPWAAMMFLRSATRKSTRYARLRQFLVLLFRVLAVLGLVLTLSRPLSGGWLGGLMSGAPDVILAVLDRSASMEAKDLGRQSTKREEGLKLIAQSAKGFEETSRIVLLENAARTPQEISGALTLPELSLTAPTDTAADLPSMLQSALDWFAQNHPGSCEIWIASDLQKSNWQPDSDRWPALASGLAALPQGVRVRLLALNKEPEANTSIAVLESTRRQRGAQTELELVLDLQRNSSLPITLPVTVVIDGARSQLDLKLEGPSLRYRHKVSLGGRDAGGWGFVELPADSNLQDNRSYFVYGGQATLRAAVVGADGPSRRILQLATAPDPRNTNQTCEVLSGGAISSAIWQDYSLVLWQGPLPPADVAKRLQGFVEDGGVLLVFPSGEAGRFGDSGWGETQEAEKDKTFKVGRWEEQDGPLGRTEEGLSLPLGEMAVIKRQAIVGEKAVLAAFEDGAPLLTRRSSGKGQILFCATLPNKEWSQLYDGAVLVPMLQRLFQTGGRKFTQAGSLACGDWTPADGSERWVAVDSAAPKDIRTQSGVYRSGAKLVAVNRPPREDEREILDAEKARALFGSLSVQLFEEQRSGSAKLQSELWRIFLFGMAGFLLIESILVLPERSEKADGARRGRGADEAGELAQRGARTAEVAK